MGGFSDLHEVDIEFSKKLMEFLIKEVRISHFNAIDVGAGIGRITKDLLVNYFESVDLLE